MIGGFAKAIWVEDDLTLPVEACTEMAAAEEGVLEHMNADHADALEAIANHAGAGEGAYRMIGCDPEGFDLLGPRGRARIPFPKLVDNLGDCRTTLVDMTNQARKAAKKA